MPGKVKVKIISGKNLPVMDRSSDTTDAYVEIKLGNTTYKTDVCRRTLHPKWNTDWYRFEVDDSELQDEPLQIRLMDHDTYSANDAIGKVYLNLNPLLLPVAGQLSVGDNNPHHEISGWIPVYDTMHGIRGEVNVTVKVELFSDFNRYRQSSCGVYFFYSPTVPQGYQAKIINGFVEELIVDDDPEYQWIDKIRTPRASNEARQTLFFKLSGELQRKIGVKALNLGGNAVIGYRQSFDLEGESGIVARGIGTAVTLVKAHNVQHVLVELKEETIENYLNFVGDGKRFSLSSASPSHKLHLSSPFKPLPTFDLNTKTRALKLTNRQYASLDIDILCPSGSHTNLNKNNNTSIKTLLNQEDKRGESAMSRRFQKFKESQKSLSKKMIALKAKLNDSIGEEPDEDLTSTQEKRKHFKRTASDSSAMAEVLARSVIHATSSLSSILEQQPESKEDDTIQKLEPIANLLDKSESQLSITDDVVSDAQSYSSSDSSSSCSDYEYRYYGKNNNDVETISNIITNVEKLQRCLSRDGLYKQQSMPAIPTRGFSLSSLDSFGKFENFPAEKQQLDDKVTTDTLLLSKSDSTSNIDLHPSEKNVCNEQTANIENTRESNSNDHSRSPKPLVTTALETKQLESAGLEGKVNTQSRSRMDPELKVRKRGSVKSIKSEAGSMVNTALKTMLFERANTLHNIRPAMKRQSEALAQSFELNRKGSTRSESKGVVKTALETMLVEKTNILGTSENQPIHSRDMENNSPENSKVHLGKVKIEDIKTNNNGNTHENKPDSSTLSHSSDQPITGIAPISKKIDLKPKKMVETAMQTMLLEKVNILGTYTPPTSPSFSSDGRSDAKKNFVFNEQNFGVRKSTIPKSFSFVSFGEHQRQKQKETVLGMTFTSLSSLALENGKTFNRDRLSCLSDSHLHTPMIETLQEKNSAMKKRFKFLHGGVFNRLLRHSKKNLPEEDPSKELKEEGKEHHQNILSRMFHLRHEEKSIKDEETQTSNELLDQPSQSQLSSANLNPNNFSVTETLSPEPPGKTDLSSGDSVAHSKTKLACVTSNRHHSSPAHDKEHIVGDKKYEHSPDPAVRISHSPVKVNYMVPLHRRSSDSDLSITPKGNSLTGSDRSMGNAAAYFMRNNYMRRGLLNQENFEMLEFPFLTMTKFSSRFIAQIGGSISARSVKLLERISNPEEPESRDIWWSEIRMEIRSHARSLNCNAVLGYTESTSICDDVCVLSACGTAAVVDLNFSLGDEDISLIQRNVERDKNLNGLKSSHDSPDHREHSVTFCGLTHLPYDEKTVPVKAKVSKCPICLRGKVPEVLIATIEPPECIPITGKGCFIESHVSRPLKDLKGETIAKEISDGLPFLEYELHRLLINKLKIRGMNSIFSLKVRISVGEKMIVGVATGTAIYLCSLPSPDLPMLVTDRVSDEKIVADLQEMLIETVKKNKEIYQIKDDNVSNKPIPDEDSDEELPSLDISCGNKDCCILEMDDPEDAEVLNLLMEEKIPDGFHVVSTESVPGLEDLEIVKNLQMFTQIYRAKLAPPYNLQKHFVRLLQSVYFKLRRMVPCALCDLQFRVDLPEPDEIQLCVIGMALGLGKKVKKIKSILPSKKPEDDMMFRLDEDPQESPTPARSKSNPSSLKYRGHRSPSKFRSQSIHHGVDITPLSYVPGGNIEQYLGNLNFFFIRETTSIREEGGLSGFIHSFITEVLAIVRSHVTALGGNALVAFFLTECVLNHNLHKNQGQCLINVGGDVVYVSYFKDDP